MGLRKFVISRIGQLAVTYWVFLTLLFVLFRAMPGDPTTLFIFEGMGPEARQERIAELGLDEPLHSQYFDYIGQLLTGDFGNSFIYREPVLAIMADKFVNTMILMGSALLLATTVGILGGALLGWWRGTRVEKAGVVTILAARSSPTFWIAIILLNVFTLQLGWFPAGGMRTVGTATSDGIWYYLNLDFLRHLFLPMLTGAIFYMATPALLMRNSMIDVIDADFIEFKEAEGLPEWRILYYHAARNSILPVVTVVAIVIGAAMGGSVIIETVYNWDGMGRAMVNAVNRRDYPLAMATIYIMGSVVIFMNFVADIAYVYLDPRVEYE